MASPNPIDLHCIFPSLFAAIGETSNPRDIGYLVGLINNIAFYAFNCFISTPGSSTDRFDNMREYAEHTLANFDLVHTARAHQLINLDELHNVVRMVHSGYMATRVPRPTWTAKNTPSPTRDQIVDMDYDIYVLLHDAVVQIMFDTGYDHRDVATMKAAYENGKFEEIEDLALLATR